MNVCWGWSWISVGIQQQNVFGPIACVVKVNVLHNSCTGCVSRFIAQFLSQIRHMFSRAAVRWGVFWFRSRSESHLRLAPQIIDGQHRQTQQLNSDHFDCLRQVEGQQHGISRVSWCADGRQRRRSSLRRIISDTVAPTDAKPKSVWDSTEAQKVWTQRRSWLRKQCHQSCKHNIRYILDSSFQEGADD